MATLTWQGPVRMLPAWQVAKALHNNSRNGNTPHQVPPIADCSNEPTHGRPSASLSCRCAVKRVRQWLPPAPCNRRRPQLAGRKVGGRHVRAGQTPRRRALIENTAESTECASLARFEQMWHIGRREGASHASKFSLANPQVPTRSTPSRAKPPRRRAEACRQP